MEDPPRVWVWDVGLGGGRGRVFMEADLRESHVGSASPQGGHTLRS